MLKVATWNINSINVRLPHILDWVKTFDPDVVLLQELKCQNDNFPKTALESAGYYSEMCCQKTYNGVAILSKKPIKIHYAGLPGDELDRQARYLQASTFDIIFASIYLPNGNPTDDGNSEKFLYKISWMDRLIVQSEKLLSSGKPFILAGDFNVCPSNEDVYDPQAFFHDALCHPKVRSRFFQMMHLGFVSALKSFKHDRERYSYWDYRGGAWQKNDGLLIDHLILSPQIADRLIDAGIDPTPRSWEKPSDHTPVWCSLLDK